MTVSPSSGLLLAVASAAAFGTAGAFGTSLLAAGWTPGAAVTTRLAVAALVLTVPALRQLRGRLRELRRGGRAVLAFGLVGVAGSQLCYFNAVAHLSVAVALLLEYSGALLVVGWLWLRHGQRPTPLTAAGGGLALAGLVLVLDLTGDQRIDPVGVLWGLGAAVGLATYFVLSASTDEPLPPLVLAWAGLAVGAVLLALAGVVGVLPLRAPRVPVTLLDTRVSWLVPVLGLSLVAAVVSYVTGIAAAQALGARLASFVGLAEVLFAVLVAWLLLGQVPGAVQLAGGVVVLAGIALVRLDELRRPPAPAASRSSPGRSAAAPSGTTR